MTTPTTTSEASPTTAVSTTPALTTTSSGDLREGRCVLWGEPHVRTFDHDSAGSVVDIFRIGDYWLVRSELISIQGRYRQTQWTNGQAATGAIAVGGLFLQGHTLVVESMAGVITWDGGHVLEALPAEFAVHGLVHAYFHEGEPASGLDPNQGQLEGSVKSVVLELPLGVRMTVNRWAQHIDVMIMMHQQVGGQDGHCGNFNGDASDDTTEQILLRTGAQVSPESLLFPKAERGAEKQVAPITLDDCLPDIRSRAEELCRKAVVGNGSALGKLHESCVFDVCFGGEEEYASADAAIDRDLGNALAARPIRWATHPDLCLEVGGGQPLNGSAVQIRGCDGENADMLFVSPGGGRGHVRWAKFPEMCLDVAAGALEEGTRLQVWRCEARHANMEFVVPAGQGPIRWATHPDKCLGVREGGLLAGTKVQLWTCSESAANQLFAVSGEAPQS